MMTIVAETTLHFEPLYNGVMHCLYSSSSPWILSLSTSSDRPCRHQQRTPCATRLHGQEPPSLACALHDTSRVACLRWQVDPSIGRQRRCRRHLCCPRRLEVTSALLTWFKAICTFILRVVYVNLTLKKELLYFNLQTSSCFSEFLPIRDGVLIQFGLRMIRVQPRLMLLLHIESGVGGWWLCHNMPTNVLLRGLIAVKNNLVQNHLFILDLCRWKLGGDKSCWGE